MKKQVGYMTAEILAAVTTPALEKRSEEAHARAMARMAGSWRAIPTGVAGRSSPDWAEDTSTLAVTPPGARIVGYVDEDESFPLPSSEEP